MGGNTLHALILLVDSIVAVGAVPDVTQQPTDLTGRFVARIAGPPLTGFGANHQAYIFEIDSASGPQFAILKYVFFLYDPQLGEHVFDYSRIFTIQATLDDRCLQSIDEISKRYIFDAVGRFVGIRYEINYSTYAPSLAKVSNKPLFCYSLTPQNVNSIR